MIRSKKDLERIVARSTREHWRLKEDSRKYPSGTFSFSKYYQANFGRTEITFEERRVRYISYAVPHEIHVEEINPTVTKYSVRVNGKVRFSEEFGEGFIEGLYKKIEDKKIN